MPCDSTLGSRALLPGQDPVSANPQMHAAEASSSRTFRPMIRRIMGGSDDADQKEVFSEKSIWDSIFLGEIVERRKIGFT